MDIGFAILVGALGVAVALFLAFRSNRSEDQGNENKKNKQQPKKQVPRGPRKKKQLQGPNIRSAESVEVEDEEHNMLQFLRGTQEQIAKERKEENRKKARQEKKVLEKNTNDESSETSEEDEEEYIIIKKKKNATEKKEKKEGGERKGKKDKNNKKKGFFKPGVFKQIKSEQQRDEQEVEEPSKGKKGKKKAEGEKADEAQEKKPKQAKEGGDKPSGEQKPKKTRPAKEGESSENKENVPEGQEGQEGENKPKRGGAFRGGRGGGRGGSFAPRDPSQRKPREYIPPPSGPYEPASLDDMLTAISSFYGTSATPKKSFFTDIPKSALFRILRSLPLKDLLKLTLVNHYLLKTINKDDKLWRSLCERDFKLKFNDRKDQDQKKRFKQVYVDEYKKAKQPKQPKAEVVA